MQTSILIVDDDEVDRLAIRRLLPGRQFRIIETTNTEDALKQVKDTDNIHCVILDYMIPGSDSMDFLQQMSARNIPTLLITGEGNDSTAVEAIKFGAYEYLTKDNITEPTLKRSISQALERHSLRMTILKQQSEMEQFAQMAAHDLRAPLRQLNFFVDQLVELYPQQDSEQADRYKQEIAKLTKYMAALIDNLLEYASVDNAGLNDTVNMKTVLDELCAMLASQISDVNARIDYRDLPDIRGNRTLISQLMGNLLVNAMKYCSPERDPHIIIRAGSHGDHWLFECQDNGRGIPASYIESVFRPFTKFNADAVIRSTGLGLSICRKIVEKHQGRIWCTSTEGVGSTFHFTIRK